MLCYHNAKNGYGEICTNRCPKRPTCTEKRIPLLIEALDILVSDIEYGESDGVFFASFKSDCIAPEAYINDLVFYMQENVSTHISSVNCVYCDRAFTMPSSQKKRLYTDNYTKYYKTTYLYCSKQCLENHIKELAESKSVASGTLKNHEYALVVHGVDVSKRLKEREVHVISGNITEQRARCLFEKLNSLIPRNKKKYLTSKEVQTFLLTDLSANIKPPVNKIEVTAWVIMNKTKELFPAQVLINNYKGKSKYIELII